jgi:hypothetical protein
VVTMSPKSSVPQAASLVSKVLMSDSGPQQYGNALREAATNNTITPHGVWDSR